MITSAQYFGPYAEHPDATAERRYHATALLDVVNDLLEVAKADGCEFPENPSTKSVIAGSRNGGCRPQDSRVGAGNSKHKEGRAVDIYDPRRQFASWCMAHPEELKKRGIHMEDPRWTPTWVHLQDVPPGSGKLVYIPSTAPALAAAPSQWETLA
ncbi:MAG TPA: hypothetical protein DDX06_01070 [Curvibacter sp.]|nr:hypothetical protein [Curvibacter sp.]